MYEGLDQIEDNTIGLFCGDHSSDLPMFTSVGNTAAVRFRSDYSVSRQGFAVAVDFITGIYYYLFAAQGGGRV